jgi:hypothetical protein
MNYGISGTSVTFINYSYNATSYFWDFGDGTSSSLSTVVHHYPASGQYLVTFIATNVCGSDTIHVVLNLKSGTGIVENNIVQNLIVFPVPTKDLLNISFDFGANQNVEIKMLNTLGQLMYDETPETITGKYDRVFDMTIFPKGMYYLQITTDKGTVNAKVVVN